MKITHYLKRHKYAIIFYIISNTIGSFCAGASTVLFSTFLSHIVAGEISVGINLLIFSAITGISCRIGWWISYVLYFKYSNKIWLEIARDLTMQSFKLSSSAFTENTSGSFVQRIMDDPNNALMMLSSIVENITEVLTGMIVIVYLFLLNYIIGILYLVALVLLFMFEIYRKKVGKKNKKELKKVNDKSYSLVTEIIKSEKDIKALDLDDKLYDITNTGLGKLKKVRLKYDLTDTNLWCARALFVELFGIFILAFGLYMMDINALTISAYVLLFSYRANFSDLIWYVGSAFKNLSEIEVSLSRMFSLYNENIYQSEKFGIKNIKNLKGKIEFRNIEYAYSEIEEVEQTKKQKQYSVKHIKQAPIFKNLSFVIEPNTTVAFVGKSGSGKSTILSLISKLNEVDKGKVLIDNVDIKKLSKKCLRDNISLINQFPYIFDMSIKENLKLVKKGATDEEIVEILDNACLTEDIAKMPKGVDTRVGETGVKLSGGQRQRLAIARALLKQTKIILFDESTSSLDNFAQSHIQQSIDKLKGKQTVVIVAHRLSTIKNVDKIYFLENGQITDSGTFNELFNKNENFKKMFLVENM